MPLRRLPADKHKRKKQSAVPRKRLLALLKRSAHVWPPCWLLQSRVAMRMMMSMIMITMMIPIR